MARILFPSYFPIGNCVKSSAQEPFGPTTYHNTQATIGQIMECYWRVKTWRIVNTNLATYFDVVNWPDQTSPPTTEEKLVCGAFSSLSPEVSYIGVDISYAVQEWGIFGSLFNSFLAVVGFTPAIYDIENPNNFYMGLYIELSWSTENPYQPYHGFSYDPLSFFTGSFTMPIILSDSIITIPMFYDSTGGYLPATGIEIRAIEWWPYEDEGGNAIYDTATGLPL